METPVVLVLILATTTFAAAASTPTIYASENPIPVGSKVTLFSRVNVTTGAWIFDNDIIVLIFPGNQIISNNWIDRVTFNSTTSSLTIRSLQQRDSGLYTLHVVNSFRAQLTLSVQVPISNVTLRANATNLVEFNDTAVLMCSVLNGSSLSYVWLNGSSEITAGGGVQLSDGGATLTMVRVTRYDEGSFRCNVSNGLSHEISLPVYLNISYGPSNTTMKIMPMRYSYITGSNITLSCSAESSPPAIIQWMVDGVYRNQFGPRFQLEMATESNSGNYQCLVHNTVTSRFSSESAIIRIMEPIAAVVVNHTSGPVILHKPFILHCEVTGSFATIQWWRNGQVITADNTTAFDMNNRTLILKRVQFSDNGNYQCQAFNFVSNMTSSPYTVEVNYGPMKPVIVGPSMALTGTQETLSCSSDSQPPSLIRWYFNDSLVATTSDLLIGPLTLNMSGKYICMAFNNITGKNSTAYKMLTVLAPVTMASIKIVGAQPIQNHTFTLTCEIAGHVDSITWMYDWSTLYADNTRNISIDNATLIFDPVMKSDNGNYKCVASNPLSNLSSQIFTLEVFYGPQMPTIMGPNAAKTGYNATFSCNASSNPPSSYQWFFNDSVVANTSEYVTLPLTEDLSGMYTCMAFNNVTGKNTTAYTMLTVFGPIEYIQVEAPMNPAIEGHFYKLTCNVSGPAGHVYWLKNGKPLHEDNRTVFYGDNNTVTFNPLEPNDTGHYQCMIINAVWNMTSPPYMLLVNFGPETPMINSPAFAETGRLAVLQCSAMSMPPGQFSWWFSGSRVANSSVFTTGPLSLNMSGEYTCMVYNYVTGKTSTNSKMLTVIEAIESVMIRNNTVPINSENLTLTCDVTGPYDMIYWSILNLTPPITNVHIENNMLHFTPVATHNDGPYQCVAFNQAGAHESPNYMLLVNYGPLSMNISGPDSTKVGVSVSLTCSADSRPDCDFHWFFNNLTSAPVAGSVITFLASEEKEGNYICEARNPVTDTALYQTKTFTVAAHASALHFPFQGGLMLMGLFALAIPVLFS